MTKVSSRQKWNSLVTPLALVLLSVIGLAKLWPYPTNQLNLFDQMAVICLITGGVAGPVVLVWNVALLRVSASPKKRGSLTVSAAVFGLGFSALYCALLIFELTYTSRPHSLFKGIIILVTVCQFLTIVSWTFVNSVQGLWVINQRRHDAKVVQDLKAT